MHSCMEPSPTLQQVAVNLPQRGRILPGLPPRIGNAIIGFCLAFPVEYGCETSVLHRSKSVCTFFSCVGESSPRGACA